MRLPNGLLPLFYPRVRARVITPFLLAIILIAGVGVFTVTRLVAGSLQERINNQLIDSANAASSAVVDTETQMLATLRAMVFTQGVASAITASDTEQLDTLLRPLLANAALDDFNLYLPDGSGLLRLRRVARPDTPGLTYDPVPPLDVRSWSGAMRVVRPAADQLGDKFADLLTLPEGMTLFISAPVIDENHSVVGGISVGLRTSRLAEQVGAQSLSSVAFLDQDGHVIGSTFRSVDDALLVLDPADTTAILDSVVATSPTIEKTLADIPYQLLYAPLKLRSQPVGLLLVGLPTNYVVERVSVSRDLTALIFSALFVVVALVGMVVARTIVNPVSRLAETARAIMNGDMTRRVGLKLPDELGDLSQSFDHMTDELVKRNREVEQLYVIQREIAAQREAVLANIRDAVVVQNLRGEVELSNQAAQQLMNYAVHSDDEHNLQTLLAQAQSDAPPETVEMANQFFRVVAAPVRKPDGEVLGRVTVLNDITAMVQAERLKDELILQMSHELRTPLAALRGNIDLIRMLEQNSLSPRAAGFFQKSVDYLGSLERLINEVIDVSSMLAGRFELHIAPMDLVSVLQEAADEWQGRMAARELSFEISLPPGEMPIDGDCTRLREVFDHILRNACSYTLPGGEVHLQMTRDDDGFYVDVEDTGVGIYPEEIERVFERMYRGTAADAGPTDSRGMGLGLYLSKHIVELHGGTIHITSEPEVGTSVHMQFHAGCREGE
ncbi:MAG: HAMP domain-containing protein [Anaerolineae bacterium]|nr:HAMP domain-containing protein [Anaerolineae bacterium]